MSDMLRATIASKVNAMKKLTSILFASIAITACLESEDSTQTEALYTEGTDDTDAGHSALKYDVGHPGNLWGPCFGSECSTGVCFQHGPLSMCVPDASVDECPAGSTGGAEFQSVARDGLCVMPCEVECAGPDDELICIEAACGWDA